MVPVGFNFDGGIADIVTRHGGYMDRTVHPNPRYIRISPKKKWSWGIDEPIFVEGMFNVKRAQKQRLVIVGLMISAIRAHRPGSLNG